MVAALDRQHPRDLFDVAGLLSGEGLSDRMRAELVVYILSHNRPAIELLAPNYRAIEAEFRDRFLGMTTTTGLWRTSSVRGRSWYAMQLAACPTPTGAF